MPPNARKSIAVLADVASMKSIWRAIRKQLRVQRFSDFDAAHDPLDWLAVDWDSGSMISTLAEELRVGAYRATKPEIVRIAKGSGLTRPKAHPKPRDLLVYRLLVWSAENALLANSKPWTRFGRSDSGDDDGDNSGDSGWFRGWLRRQGQLWTITENHAWLVETDISNFFPSVPMQPLLEHVLANSNLAEDSVRLIEHQLRQAGPLPDYRDLPGGLPQDNFNCSRVLAHTFLKPLDEEFQAEGEKSQYSRWVDDIVIGAASRDEALMIVSRVQFALERLGLYANTAKTRVIEAEKFVSDYMKYENDYLGDVEDRYRAGTVENIDEFREHLRKHLEIIEPLPQPPILLDSAPTLVKAVPKGWGAILRRFYTQSRYLRDETLLDMAVSHIDRSPDCLRQILEYLATFPLESQRLSELFNLLDRLGGVYEDVHLLVGEYIAVAPNDDSDEIRKQISEWATGQIARWRSTKPRLAASACLVLGKFGFESDFLKLKSLVEDELRNDSVLRQQASVVLLGVGLLDIEHMPHANSDISFETSQHLRFLHQVVLGDSTAIGMSLNLLTPGQRRDPLRFVCRPRMLFLAPILRKSAPKKVATVEHSWKKQLQNSSANFRDRAAERWLGI